MTDKEINRAIAEACGWKCAGHPDQLKATDGWEFGYQFVIRPDGQLVTHNSIPNYCGDLNAMHNAEKMLNTDELFEQYYLTLYETTQSTRWPVSATARQRAEAFLRTIGKWKD